MIRCCSVLLVLALGGCSAGGEGPVEPAAEPPQRRVERRAIPAVPPAGVRTDRSSYRLAPGPRGGQVVIAATLRAPDDQTLYILNCNGASGLALQRKVEDGWESAWLVSMNACFSPPIVIPPGGEHAASLDVHQNAANAVRPSGLVSGTYRLVWSGVLTGYDPDKPPFGPELPLEQRVSPPFSIEVR